ncbi:hypothetical protein NYE48_22880 [Paenibacillus sp. FSL M7-1455]|jgi:ABC-type transporter Mla subunit MlaD|uniref:hypothetical protein n=1 Tax=Paenibacillus sp. FSL M7-1455 TaxID=2975316 RepID=UPI0030F7C10D
MNASLTGPIFAALIVLLFIGLLFRQIQKTRESNRDAANIRNILKELQNEMDIPERFNKMNDWILQREGEYLKKFVRPGWDAFYRKYIHQENGMRIPDVYDYIQEEKLVNDFGKRRFVELVPGMFLSIGILGTFWGIASGVQGLDPNGDSEAMKSGIGILLHGMQTKFISSMVGIFASLIWQAIDKNIVLPKLQSAFLDIRESFDEAFPTQDQNSLLQQMLENQKSQMNDFQIFMSEQLIPQMITGFNDTLKQSLLPPMEQTQVLMNELITSASVNQMDGVKQLTAEVMNSLNELTGEQMKNLSESINKTVEWQERVHEEMSNLVESMQQSARNQSEMVEKTTVLTQEIHQYTDNITDYQKVLEGTVSQLNDTTSKNSELQSVVSGLLDRMVEERNVFNQYFDEHLAKLQSNVESIIIQTEYQVKVQTLLEQNLERITDMADSQQVLATSLSDQAVLSKKSSEELGHLVEQFENNATLFTELQGRVGGMLEQSLEEQSRLDKLIEKVNFELVDQVEAMDERTEKMISVWEENSQLMKDLNRQLSTSINQFADDMHRGIMRTFEQFDEELTKSVNLLTRGVDSMRDGLVEMPEVIQELKQSVNEINRLAKRATLNT